MERYTCRNSVLTFQNCTSQRYPFPKINRQDGLVSISENGDFTYANDDTLAVVTHRQVGRAADIKFGDPKRTDSAIRRS